MEQTGISFIEARITIYFFFINTLKQLSSEFFQVKLFIIPVKLDFWITFNEFSL